MCVSELIAVPKWKYIDVLAWKILRRTGKDKYVPLYAGKPPLKEGKVASAIYTIRGDGNMGFNPIQSGLFESFLREEDARDYMRCIITKNAELVRVLCNGVHALGSDSGSPAPRQ